MRKITKIWLIIASSLVLAGCVILGGVMNMLQWDFTKLSTGKYETNHYEISETFSNISVETDTTDLTFALSDDGNCRVECYEDKKAKHSVSVEEDTLIIKVNNEKSWYDYIGLHFGSPKITVCLPNAEYAALAIRESTGNVKLPNDFKFESINISLSTGNVDCFASATGMIKIKTSTGKIDIENVAAGALDLTTSTGGITVSNAICEGDLNTNVSTGKTDLTDIACRNLISKGSTGNISLHHVTAVEKLSIQRSTGNVKFDSSDAAEVFIETSTGNVTGTFLSEKIFFAETDTGRVNVPQSTAGGKCEITTDTGNIRLDIQ